MLTSTMWHRRNGERDKDGSDLPIKYLETTANDETDDRGLKLFPKIPKTHSDWKNYFYTTQTNK